MHSGRSGRPERSGRSGRPGCPGRPGRSGRPGCPGRSVMSTTRGRGPSTAGLAGRPDPVDSTDRHSLLRRTIVDPAALPDQA
ncbi:hypothetical protein GBW32_07690 [Streptomyces tsukubensis]|nr:hypothetical protein GBW32_07690 [Streptomyces tsukubensis]